METKYYATVKWGKWCPVFPVRANGSYGQPIAFHASWNNALAHTGRLNAGVLLDRQIAAACER